MPATSYCLVGSAICLSPEVWAAWAQAVGSVGAILVAIGVAGWQAYASRELLAAQRRQGRIDTAQTLAVITDACQRLVARQAEVLKARERVYELADSRRVPDWAELLAMERRLDAIPLHELPARLVAPAIAVAGTVRQYRTAVETTLDLHRQMDSQAFADFFEALGAMDWKLAELVGELDREVKNYASGVHG